MKQPSKGTGRKAPVPKIKRKSREQLDLEARERKRQKKRRGHVAGSRTQPSGDHQHNAASGKVKDPRIGSKKPVSLLPEGAVAPVKPPVTPKEKPVRLSPQEELEMLENDPHLDDLLDRLEKGETLPAKEQSWLDETLDRIDILMEQLGISLDDDEDEDDDEQEEDMLQLLRRSNPKDSY
ncbi:Der GTPase-activating protein YihI [Dickeya sp. CFBP 2040]|uniref:Der GTPase-activating protein YihI n=1 Tax=Dickeya sp. CFBP 2040 TaxID=2718531 RepID=UPI001445228D|nr:Der GTPase-activating protein YihI [Dickeya sp. CFBP 2040]NKI75072.1 Der GTPase-activating protein YihI [Dickeya sp. CFBP 2040]